MGRKAKLRAKRKALNFVRSDEINWAFVGNGAHQDSCLAVAEVLHGMAKETICSDELGFIFQDGVCLSVVWHKQRIDERYYYAKIYFDFVCWLESVACKPSDLDASVISLSEIVTVKVSATSPLEIESVQEINDVSHLTHRILPVLWTASPPREGKHGSFVVAAEIEPPVVERAFELSEAYPSGHPFRGFRTAVNQWIDNVYSEEMEIATREQMHRPPLAQNFATLRGQLLANYEADLRIDPYV